MKEFDINNLEEWESEIVNQYPSLYITPSPTVRSYINKGVLDDKDAVNLRFGFECEKGWASLIVEWSERVKEFQSLVWKSGDNPEFAIFPCIIKEKFGTLRFQNDMIVGNRLYCDLWDYIESAIEKRSEHTCECCGKWGQITKTGWWKVICENCKNK